MNQYQFKTAQEIAWAAAGAVAVFVFEIARDFDPATVTNWETWAVTAIGGLVRAVGVAALAIVGKAAVSPVTGIGLEGTAEKPGG